MYRILSGLAAIVMTAGTVAFANPAQAASGVDTVACEKSVTAGAREIQRPH
jgi:predicted lysophospholipase L1 biosynthesis ABC-type transport system permease subunit